MIGLSVIAMAVVITITVLGIIAFGASTNKRQNEVEEVHESVQDALTKLTDEITIRTEREKQLIKRIQNLEAIVTNEAWDALGDEEALEAVKLSLNDLPDLVKTDDAARLDLMARRLRS